MCCDGIGNYYVTDIVGHTVSVYDAKGNIRKRFGYQGTKITELNQPVALTINQRHEVDSWLRRSLVTLGMFLMNIVLARLPLVEVLLNLTDKEA